MSYSWDFDAPTGTFKNHTLSADVYETALENSVAMRFVEVQSEYGKNKGDTLTFNLDFLGDQTVTLTMYDVSTIMPILISDQSAFASMVG